ncbi:copper chaperone PCu(A)C [Streptomyces sp. B1866]|uniref:copper chaperone PCu(A)C n=1 Tax=Streptomyces sp. B1866 TaxID=3075431 RepID=UPI002891349F|nr:copper chaperone PCu(A)C [Streptomyces sp. B1866]MDT3400406.1 copper chaperone PCu(A)C [Streptomyces sp. B1866]
MRLPASVRRAVGAALAPLAAGALALGGLTAWVLAGAAGSPAAPAVTGARLLLPSNPEATAAFFDIRNTGGADDALVGVTAPWRGRAMLGRRVVRAGAGSMRMVDAVAVPAGGTLRMSASGVDVMVRRPPRLRVGDRVPFVLRFRDSGPVRVTAVVVRPGS